MTTDPEAYESAYDTAKRIVDREACILIAAIMKKLGVTQIDISAVELTSEDRIETVFTPDKFLRIRGYFELVPKE